MRTSPSEQRDTRFTLGTQKRHVVVGDGGDGGGFGGVGGDGDGDGGGDGDDGGGGGCLDIFRPSCGV